MKTKTVGTIEFEHIKPGYEWCSTHHPNRAMNKMADCKVFIMGNPAGYLCRACEKEWTKAYEELCPK